MSDLTGFLLARVSEDEAAARAVLDAPGVMRMVDAAGHYHCHHAAYEGTWVTEGTRTDCGLGIDHEYDADEPWHALVNRYDPARAMAECEAKRRIVERQDCDTDCGDLDCVVIREDRRIIAQPYADHPDFDPAWRL